MPRIRTLKPEHRQHRKVGPLNHIAYRLWVGMLLEADDEGRLVYDPEALRVLVFGYHPDISRGLVEDSAKILEDSGLIRRYLAEGQAYACFPSWHDHQRLDHPTPSKLPSPQPLPPRGAGALTVDSVNAREGSVNPREASASPRENSRGIRKERKGKEGIGKERNGGESAAAAEAPRARTVNDLVAKFSGLEAYQGLDVRRAVLRCETWCETNNKTFTVRRVTNWLNRDAADHVMGSNGTAPPKRAGLNEAWVGQPTGRVQL